MQYRTKPIVVDAVQWFRAADDLEVQPFDDVVPPTTCPYCQRQMAEHGVLYVPPVRYLICPGDWIITEVGDYPTRYTCPAAVFWEKYDAIDS